MHYPRSCHNDSKRMMPNVTGLKPGNKNRQLIKMSYLSNYVDCPNLQSQINGFFGCDKRTLLKQNESSLAMFLMSQANTNNVLSQSVNPGAGKLRTVELVYTPRILSGDVGTTIIDECTASTPHGNRSKTYTIDPNTGVFIERRIDLSELATICEADEDFISKMMLDMMSAAIRKMDIILASQVVLLSGNFGQGETGIAVSNSEEVKTVRTRRSSTDSGLSDNFISEIDFAAENAGYCGNPMVFGYGEIWKAAKELKASCCSDSGINVALLSEILGTMFTANRNVPTALSSASVTADFMTIDPGAVQILSYLRYEGPNGIRTLNDDAYKQTVLTDPGTGISFDFRMTNTCGKLNFFISKAFKAVGVPTDQFYAGDIYDGTTGVNLYHINNS